MNRQITQEETKQLFQFCRDHFVYHYDVQIELVDHLASSIEEQWIENPDIAFEQSLHKTFRKFGITGFSKVKVEKEKALTRKYNRVLLKYLIEFYRWPKMLLTLAITLGLFLLFQIANGITWIMVPYFALLTIAGFFYYYRYAPKLEIKTIKGKKFMLLEQLKQFQIGAVVACQLPVNSYNVTKYIDLSLSGHHFILFLFALGTVGLNIILFGYFFYIPKKIKEHFMEQFSEFAV